MTDQLMEFIYPVIAAIILGLVGYLTYMIKMFFNYLQVKSNAWFDARTTAAQREQLHRLAAEAYARAEKIGTDKLNVAIEYVTRHMQNKSIPITNEEIKAAVDKAWFQLDKKNKV